MAPFFTDINIASGVGSIYYEIHTNNTSGSILSRVNSVINEHTETNFNGEWMLVATWDQVPPFGGSTSIVRYQNFPFLKIMFSFSDKYISRNTSNQFLVVLLCLYVQVWGFGIF